MISLQRIYQQPVRCITVILVVHSLLWILLSSIDKPSLDSYGDMVENYAWGQEFFWGSHKHPPLIGWITRAWFNIFPTTTTWYYVLSYLNAAAGIVGLVFITRLINASLDVHIHKSTSTILCTVFAILSFSYSNLAGKYNADTILLSLWPWTTYLFLRCMQAFTNNQPRRQQWLWALALAILACASMLAKYYSAVLLLTFFIVSLSRPYRAWYTTPIPYLIVVLFLGLMTPHLMWEYRMDFPFTQYVGQKFNNDVSAYKMIKFLLTGVFLLPLTWSVFFICMGSARIAKAYAVARTSHIFTSMVLIAILPALITITLHVMLSIHLTTHWAIPIWFSLPVVLACLCGCAHIDISPQGIIKKLLWFWLVLFIGGSIYAVSRSYQGNKNFTLARDDMVAAIDTTFKQRFGKQRLGWAAGQWSEIASLSFYGADHPRALPSTPNTMPALVNPHPTWTEEYGALVCFHGSSEHLKHCQQQNIQWLSQRNVPIIQDTIAYQPTGWMFMQHPVKHVTVFWYEPPRK